MYLFYIYLFYIYLYMIMYIPVEFTRRLLWSAVGMFVNAPASMAKAETKSAMNTHKCCRQTVVSRPLEEKEYKNTDTHIHTYKQTHIAIHKNCY